MTAAWVVVLLAAAWIGFAYLGYPLGLILLRRVSPRPVRKREIAPPLSLIIAVHNGERELRDKLETSLALGYAGPVEIIVSSDGSTDGTVEVARNFEARGVLVIESGKRGGKEAAQARAIARAKGEILVFTDVSAELEPGALSAIVCPFADPAVGAVSSEDRVDSEEGEGAYVRYEMALRRLESQASTLVGLSGSFFAIRRELAHSWCDDLASDFRSALEASRRSLRAVSEPDARARFRATHDPAAEWRRKVRTVRRGLAVLSEYRDLLHPRHGRVAFSLWGHKVARFTSPFALLALLLVSCVGASQSPALATLAGLQLAAYGTGLAALVLPPVARFRIPRLAGFFLIVNASMLAAWAYHFTGRRSVTWTPTRR